MKKPTGRADGAGKHYKCRIVTMVGILVVLFAAIVGIGMRYSAKYIEKQLLLSNQADAVDISMLISNHFSISDAEVAQLKSLTFNEMENNPINLRLMNSVSGLALNDKVSNMYVLVLLPDDEVRYTADEETAQFLGCKVGTKLNGMWLLNGKFDDADNFVSATRDDVYRYLELCDNDRKIFESRKSFGLISEDAWGKFITGYTPLYTNEGNYVGVLGVDMDINHYNARVEEWVGALLGVFSLVVLALLVLFVVFFAKYMKTKEGVLYYQFYSRLSHDLRTPMNGILGLAELSKNEKDPAVLRENIGKMEESGQYLLGLINDTLDFQKMQSGKLALHPAVVDSRALVQDVVNMVSATAQTKDIRFEVKTLSLQDNYILADGMRLKQIFVNLLSNALKFTPNGGRVEWTIERLSAEGNRVNNVFTVRDTGIGMSEKFLKTEIFKPFAQEYNSTTAQYAGTGLGLSIVKSLVEQMGGRIEVESTPGEGTTFRVYLSFEKIDAAKAEQQIASQTEAVAHTAEALRGKRLLLAEDHPLNAEIARRMLEKQGCEVRWAENGEKAVEAFRNAPVGEFDAVLMDIRMPVLDGLAATRAIRALSRPDATTVPILAMTANAYDTDIADCLEAGMNAHLAKPIDPARLYAALEQCLK